MFGLDDLIASYSDGAAVWIVLLVAILLGLRHATDPDHIAAVTTLVAGAREQAARRAGELGLAWGARPRPDALRVRPPDPAPGQVPARARPAGRRDGDRLRDRLPRRPAARPLAAGSVPRARPRPRRRQAQPSPRPAVELGHGHAHPQRSRRWARSASASCTAWAEAPASGSCSSPRSSRPGSRWRALALLAIFTGVSMTILSTGFGATLASRPVRTSFEVVARAGPREPRLRDLVRNGRVGTRAVPVLSAGPNRRAGSANLQDPMIQPELHDLAAAYALDALDPEDRWTYEQHLVRL